MIKEYFKSWTRFEILYVLFSITAVVLSGIIFKSEIVAILQAKGKVESQVTSLMVCLFYSYVSFRNKYFGEVIFYLLIMFPMSIFGIISWKRHKSDKTDTVEIKEMKIKDWILILVVSMIGFVFFYYFLKYINTNQLVVSTLSMLASLLAVYLLVRRNKYGFIFYILNDIILIILWGLPVLSGNFVLIPILIDPICMLINDIYGIINWNKIENKQNT